MMSLPNRIHGLPHTVDRNCIFESVVALYQTTGTLIHEYPLTISFAGERAIDLGGVTRDMYSAFFDEAYQRFFDGCTLLTPAIHPNINFSTLPLFGTILSHSYLASGMLPVRVAFPCLAHCLLGHVELSNEVFFDSLINSLSLHDATVLRSAFSEADAGVTTFKRETESGLLELASRYESRMIPRPTTVRDIFLQIAKYTFIHKPAASITAINSGIPIEHTSFWKTLGVERLHRLYRVKSVSPAKVIKMVDEAEALDRNQEKVISYLKQYIGSLNSEDLQRFLRFVTGTSCITKKIGITFNTLSGAARRPIAHTCELSLELSSTYSTYIEFARELRSVVSTSGDSLWGMNAL